MHPTSETSQRQSHTPGSVAGFTAFGVPVRFHFTFVLLAIFLAVMALEDDESALGDVAFIGALFASVLLHELGHAVVARRFGVRTTEIVMFPIGGIARLDRTPEPRKELWIAAAGPLVNLFLALSILGVAGLTQDSVAGFQSLANRTDANLLESIAFGNLVLALFNLLPAFPMDGGRILRAVIALWRPETEATRLAARAGRMLAIGIGLYGLLAAQYLLLFIAFFVYLGAAQESQAAIGRQFTHGLPVRAAMMTKIHTIGHSSTVGDAAQMLLDTSQQDFPVVHGNQVIGLLNRNTLLRAMATEGAGAYVAGVMDRDFLKLTPDLELGAAMTLLATAGPCALVMVDDRLVGMLTRENLSEFILLRRVGMDPAQRSPSDADTNKQTF